MDRLIDTSIFPNPLHPEVGDVYGRSHAGPEGFKIGDGLPRRVVVSEIHEDGQIFLMVDGEQRGCSDWRLFLASIPGIEQIGRVRMHGPCSICGAPMRPSEGFRVCGNGHPAEARP